MQLIKILVKEITLNNSIPVNKNEMKRFLTNAPERLFIDLYLLYKYESKILNNRDRDKFSYIKYGIQNNKYTAMMIIVL